MFHDFLEKFYRTCAKGIVHVLYNCKFSGFENVPEEGGAIIIANHVSYMDGLVLNAASDRKMRFIIDHDIYHTPGVNHFMKMDRAIPIKPTKESVKEALKKVSEGLQAGDLIAIFPEGQITYTGHMIRFKLGIEWIVAENKVPIIPVALNGLWGSIFSRKYINHKWPFIPRKFRMKVTAVCGKPIPHEKAKINYLQRELMKLRNTSYNS